MESDGFFDIEYSSSKELYTSLQAKALKLKFSLSILRSDYKKKKVISKCDRAGDYKSAAQLQRARLEKAGVKPKAQLTALRQDHPGLSGVERDMYNDQQKPRKEYLGGHTPIQALVDELQLKEYRFMLQRGAEGHITHLLLSNPSDSDAALLKAEEQVFPSATRLLCRWHINKSVLAKCKDHFKSGDEWESTLVDWNLLCGASSSGEFEVRWADFQAKLHHVPAVTRYLETTWIKHKEKFVEAWVGKVFHLGCSTTSRAESTHAYLKRFLRSSAGHLLFVFESLHLGIENQVIELRRLHADDRLKRPTFAANSVYAQVVNKVSAHALSLARKHVSHVSVEACSTKFTVTLGLPCRHTVQARIDDDPSLTMADFDPYWWLDHFSIGSENRSLSVSENRNVQLDDVIPRFLQVFEAAPTHQQTAIRGQLENMILRGSSSSVMDPLASKPKGRPPGATNRHKRQRDPFAFEIVEGSAQMTRKCSVCKHYGHNEHTCPNTAAV